MHPKKITNFQELLDSPLVSEKENRQWIDHLVSGLQGESTPGPLMRVTLQLSTDATEEENLQAIADAMGYSIEQVRAMGIDIPGSVAKVRANSDAVKARTASFHALLAANPKTARSKFEELQDVGRFLVASGQEFQLDLSSIDLPYPDFIIKFGNELIGLEHTRLLDSKDRELRSAINGYLKQAAKRLNEQENTAPRLVNIVFNYHVPAFDGKPISSRSLSRAQKQLLVDAIVKGVESVLTSQQVQLPVFIDQIIVTDHRREELDLTLSESYTALQDFNELLAETIQKKEDKYSSYVSKAAVKECWLLVYLDGINSYSGFDLSILKVPILAQSNFSRVILFEGVGSKIIDLH